MVNKAKPNGFHGTIKVKGLNYRLEKADYAQIEKVLDDEDSLLCRLETEPTNEADPFAIKVLIVDGKQIGYVERPVNKPLFKFLEMGARVKVCLLRSVDSASGEADLELEVIKQKPPQ